MTDPDLETDPRTVLDPTHFGDTDWGTAYETDPELARDRFVAALRSDPTRTNPDTDLAALRRRWFGAEVGFERGFRLEPDAVIEGRHVGVYGIEHTFEDDIDWFHNASADDPDADFSPEWQWQLNRHYQWVTLADAYEESGDPRYAEAFERELRSWVRECPRPDDSGNYHPSAWRTIEAGIRAGWIWPYAFETFRRSDAVSDEALWWLVCALREHGRHLLEHVTGDNWKTMEANGLLHVGAMFPELDGAGTFLSTGIDRVVAEVERQFYPDGLQTELSPGYAMVSISNCYSALELADQTSGARYGRAATSVPERSGERLDGIARAYARLAAPNGRCPLLHDSKHADARPVYHEFIDDPPPWESDRSDRLPWGGYGILRNEGRYALLDAGPYGTGHQHQDTLQVVGYAAEDWALVDLGSPQYTDSPITEHIRSAAGHNVVLLDGNRHGVVPERHRTEEPLPLAVAESGPLAAAAATRTLETTADVRFDQERVLCDVAGAGWLVFDRLRPRDDRPHTAEWLWHAAGPVTPLDGGGTIETTSGAEVSISVAAEPSMTARAVSGETDPYRGWGPSGETVEPAPAPTLSVESGRWSGGAKAVTVLSPTGASIVEASLEKSTREIQLSTDAGSKRLQLSDADGQVDAVSLVSDSGTVEVGLEAHAFLADR